jgi:hypothetical protein
MSKEISVYRKKVIGQFLVDRSQVDQFFGHANSPNVPLPTSKNHAQQLVNMQNIQRGVGRIARNVDFEDL